MGKKPKYTKFKDLDKEHQRLLGRERTLMRMINDRMVKLKPHLKIVNKFRKELEPLEDELEELKVPICPRSISISNFIPVDPKDIRTFDELFAMPPPVLTRSKTGAVYNEEDECVFSNRQGQGQKREPILKTQTRFKKSLTLGEIVAENPERAIGSRDLCGNL